MYHIFSIFTISGVNLTLLNRYQRKLAEEALRSVNDSHVSVERVAPVGRKPIKSQDE